MHDSPPTARIYGLALLLLGAWLGLHVATREPVVPASRPLRQFPLHLGGWTGVELPLEPRILHALRLHDYLNRVYFSPQLGSLGFYVAYYPRQRFGDDIHSPKNCLPGSGWEPIRSGALTIALPDAQTLRVNDYLVGRDARRDLILYWYQQQGRVVRSEYWSKFYQIWDGLTQHRSDAALVRVASPIRSGGVRAQQRAVRFIQLAYPRLRAFLPD